MGSGGKTDERVKRPGAAQVPAWYSRLFMCWMFPAFFNGYRRDLEEDDLVPNKRMYGSKLNGDKLEKNWILEEAAAKSSGRAPSFTKVLFKTFIWSYIPCGIMQLGYTALRTVTPLLFARLLSYWTVGSGTSRAEASIYAGAMIGCNLLAAFFNHHGNLHAEQFGMKLRFATSSLMFRKIMRMDNASLGDTAAGKVVNLLSNDLQRYDLAFLFLHYVWIIPLQLGAVCYIGWYQAGVSSLIGIVALIIIALPIQSAVSRVFAQIRERMAVKTDNRIKIMSEVINGIQVIKMYAWEMPFEKVVTERRADELREVRHGTMMRCVFLGFMLFTERIALFLTILTYTLLGNSLSATVIYPLQQVMSAAQINITLVLPLILAFTAELKVSLGRIQEFLSMNERPDLASVSRKDNFTKGNEMNGSYINNIRPISYQQRRRSTIQLEAGNKLRRSISHQSDIAVEVSDVSCSWIGDPNFMALKNISLRIKRGKLCAVIGAVGSGKSSFLHLLLRELVPASGTVTLTGKVSYSSQEAWMFPNTVRENILFGLPYDAQKYKKVCRACALEKDFKQFPYSDQTLVGERGVSLSGGQRARINLARAVYREADIYLLDDPLSAVDANVGRQLFEGCVNGYLRGRTRVLVTHQIHFLKAADYIVVLNQGMVENMGTFDELVSSGKEFATLLATLQDGKDKDTESLTSSGSTDSKRQLLRLRSSITEMEDDMQFEAQKMSAEERQSGSLRWSVIFSYFSAGGGASALTLVLFTILLAAASAAAADYWISYWTNQISVYEATLDGAEMDASLNTQVGMFTTWQYLVIHGVIVTSCLILTHVRIVPLAQLCVSASGKLHNFMFSTMLRGVMRFFDTSSSGRILNRFTKDMGSIDDILPRCLLDVLQIYSTLLAILVLNAVALYWTLLPSALLMIIFAWFVKVYLKAAQSIKRLEGTTKSPVFGMVTSSLSGIATIRCSDASERLVKEFDEIQDLNMYAWNGYLGGGTTFGIYLDSLCLVYLTIIIFVFLYLDLDGVIPVGSVGLAVTQSNTLTAMLQHGARMLVEFIAQLTSVERVLEYTRIDTEENLFEGKAPTPPEWPAHGRVVFKDVNLRYAPDEAPVLKELNIVIESGWKVGIVGRTGAGKSSLISAMFRFAFIDGEMTIDGLDTALVGKQDLRSKISIIPQEPVLFSATVRYNLDPFGIYSDDDLWRALEQVDLKTAIPSLDFKITEGGSNFSVGQRQLVCLARAVLRSNKVLIMDEATANVDPQTDNFIQQTIRRAFASCTVLTIAHRLNTVMDSDRVLVMDAGRAAEFDHPYLLLSDPNSRLSSMTRETGERMADQLLNIAKDAYFQSNIKENAR